MHPMMMVMVVVMIVMMMVVVMVLRHLNRRRIGCRLFVFRRQNLRGVWNRIEQFAE